MRIKDVEEIFTSMMGPGELELLLDEIAELDKVDLSVEDVAEFGRLIGKYIADEEEE